MSQQHFNVQISIQQVTEPEPMMDKGGYPVKALGGVAMTERKITKVLDLAITADSEREAYDKAHRMLKANVPEPVQSRFPDVFLRGEPEEHLHRASCDDSAGNKVCGFPPGPTIASR